MQATPPPADMAAPLAFGAIFIVIWLAIAVLSLAGMVFWIVALVDCAKRDFPGQNDKLMWILIVVLAGIPGALIYWFVGRPRGAMLTA